MTLAPVFRESFAPLIGSPCWQVGTDYGSFITLEFGDPHLEVREPRNVAAERSSDARQLLTRRNVTVRGQWHLWIYCCAWKIRNGDRLVGASDDDDSFADASQLLDGQALTDLSIDEPASCRFAFDLGGSLTTSPYDDNSEQWMLYEPDGNVLTLRADGTYCHCPSNSSQDAWSPAWGG